VFSLRPEGKTARFRSIRDSSGIALFQSNGFFFGPVGRFQRARKEGDHSDQLHGLGDVDWALEAGFFAEYWFADWFRTRAEVRRGFNGHEGFVGDLFADFIAPLGEKWSVSGGPRLSLADTDALRPYFGIDAVQSAASGLSAFDPKGGLKSVGVGGQVQYQFNKHWASRAYLEYERLLGDAATSPLVTERGAPNQVTFGVGLSYSSTQPSLNEGWRRSNLGRRRMSLGLAPPALSRADSWPHRRGASRTPDMRATPMFIELILNLPPTPTDFSPPFGSKALKPDAADWTASIPK